MLNENKIKMMTKMAIFEKNNDKELLCHTKYYKNDYVTFNIIKCMATAMIAYILVVLLIVAYNLDYIVANVNSLDYVGLGMTLVWTFLVFVLAYGFLAFFVYSRRYENSRDGVKKYFSRLSRLEKYYNNQKK